MGKQPGYKMSSKIILSVISLLPFSVFSQYSGGTDDGFSSFSLPRTNITDEAAFRGGNGNGFTAVVVSRLDFGDAIVFRGGTGDGFHSILLPLTNITDANAFRGGFGRGETQANLLSCNGETVVWNGSQNTDWHNPANWNCTLLPDVNSNVIIPFAVPNYPVVSSHVEIRSLQVSANATITVNNSVQIILNGQ